MLLLCYSQFTPKKGSASRRNEILFISPTGEEIRNKRQLEQYLKSHPGGPSSSEFDWGTGSLSLSHLCASDIAFIYLLHACEPF